MISGEATLICKTPGMKVVAGSQNHQGAVLVQLTHLPYQNTLRVISAMVDEAKTSKPRLKKLQIGLRLSCPTHAWYHSRSLHYLDCNWNSCPTPEFYYRLHQCHDFRHIYTHRLLPLCDWIGVPIVVLIAGGVAARHGLIFKAAETINIARKVDHVIFDKTGTLTQGSFLSPERNI